MKKLVIAVAIVCAAVAVQAANYSWSSAGYNYAWDSADPDWAAVPAGLTAYFVFTDAYSQSALVDDFAAGTVDYTKLSAAGNGVTIEGGYVEATAATSSYTSDKQVYFVVFQDDAHMFVSGEMTAAYDALSGSTVTFGDDETGNLWTETPYNAADGYSVGGWYQTVPEPTSGLLLLLGVAGLALRRRRA